ncbi:hypothetical protein BESB_046560 [Besnoitia besnoiti]|uniref:Uncharacterized protein n=1 Tax=Besnoitia besnoiti TaxID=94643 RepID=A0A2A9MH25_BESBE|nr:hypothetical protein BESB_046560 [Besnoitia besnoiti]PFH36464.1 hypothetical protein BESB_046560 [Besnoitia besnoiti]
MRAAAVARFPAFQRVRAPASQPQQECRRQPSGGQMSSQAGSRRGRPKTAAAQHQPAPPICPRLPHGAKCDSGASPLLSFTNVGRESIDSAAEETRAPDRGNHRTQSRQKWSAALDSSVLLKLPSLPTRLLPLSRPHQARSAASASNQATGEEAAGRRDLANLLRGTQGAGNNSGADSVSIRGGGPPPATQADALACSTATTASTHSHIQSETTSERQERNHAGSVERTTDLRKGEDARSSAETASYTNDAAGRAIQEARAAAAIAVAAARATIEASSMVNWGTWGLLPSHEPHQTSRAPAARLPVFLPASAPQGLPSDDSAAGSAPPRQIGPPGEAETLQNSQARQGQPQERRYGRRGRRIPAKGNTSCRSSGSCSCADVIRDPLQQDYAASSPVASLDCRVPVQARDEAVPLPQTYTRYLQHEEDSRRTWSALPEPRGVVEDSDEAKDSATSSTPRRYSAAASTLCKALAVAHAREGCGGPTTSTDVGELTCGGVNTLPRHGPEHGEPCEALSGPRTETREPDAVPALEQCLSGAESEERVRRSSKVKRSADRGQEATLVHPGGRTVSRMLPERIREDSKLCPEAARSLRGSTCAWRSNSGDEARRLSALGSSGRSRCALRESPVEAGLSRAVQSTTTHEPTAKQEPRAAARSAATESLPRSALGFPDAGDADVAPLAMLARENRRANFLGAAGDSQGTPGGTARGSKNAGYSCGGGEERQEVNQQRQSARLTQTCANASGSRECPEDCVRGLVERKRAVEDESPSTQGGRLEEKPGEPQEERAPARLSEGEKQELASSKTGFDWLSKFPFRSAVHFTTDISARRGDDTCVHRPEEPHPPPAPFTAAHVALCLGLQAPDERQCQLSMAKRIGDLETQLKNEVCTKLNYRDCFRRQLMLQQALLRQQQKLLRIEREKLELQRADALLLSSGPPEGCPLHAVDSGTKEQGGSRVVDRRERQSVERSRHHEAREAAAHPAMCVAGMPPGTPTAHAAAPAPSRTGLVEYPGDLLQRETPSTAADDGAAASTPGVPRHALDRLRGCARDEATRLACAQALHDGLAFSSAAAAAGERPNKEEAAGQDFAQLQPFCVPRLLDETQSAAQLVLLGLPVSREDPSAAAAPVGAGVLLLAVQTSRAPTPTADRLPGGTRPGCFGSQRAQATSASPSPRETASPPASSVCGEPAATRDANAAKGRRRKRSCPSSARVPSVLESRQPQGSAEVKSPSHSPAMPQGEGLPTCGRPRISGPRSPPTQSELPRISAPEPKSAGTPSVTGSTAAGCPPSLVTSQTLSASALTEETFHSSVFLTDSVDVAVFNRGDLPHTSLAAAYHPEAAARGPVPSGPSSSSNAEVHQSSALSSLSSPRIPGRIFCRDSPPGSMEWVPSGAPGAPAGNPACSEVSSCKPRARKAFSLAETCSENAQLSLRRPRSLDDAKVARSRLEEAAGEGYRKRFLRQKQMWATIQRSDRETGVASKGTAEVWRASSLLPSSLQPPHLRPGAAPCRGDAAVLAQNPVSREAPGSLYGSPSAFGEGTTEPLLVACSLRKAESLGATRIQGGAKQEQEQRDRTALQQLRERAERVVKSLDASSSSTFSRAVNQACASQPLSAKPPPRVTCAGPPRADKCGGSTTSVPGKERNGIRAPGGRAVVAAVAPDADAAKRRALASPRSALPRLFAQSTSETASRPRAPSLRTPSRGLDCRTRASEPSIAEGIPAKTTRAATAPPAEKASTENRREIRPGLYTAETELESIAKPQTLPRLIFRQDAPCRNDCSKSASSHQPGSVNEARVQGEATALATRQHVPHPGEESPCGSAGSLPRSHLRKTRVTEPNGQLQAKTHVNFAPCEKPEKTGLVWRAGEANRGHSCPPTATQRGQHLPKRSTDGFFSMPSDVFEGAAGGERKTSEKSQDAELDFVPLQLSPVSKGDGEPDRRTQASVATVVGRPRAVNPLRTDGQRGGVAEATSLVHLLQRKIHEQQLLRDALRGELADILHRQQHQAEKRLDQIKNETAPLRHGRNGDPTGVHICTRGDDASDPTQTTTAPVASRRSLSLPTETAKPSSVFGLHRTPMLHAPSLLRVGPFERSALPRAPAHTPTETYPRVLEEFENRYHSAPLEACTPYSQRDVGGATRGEISAREALQVSPSGGRELCVPAREVQTEPAVEDAVVRSDSRLLLGTQHASSTLSGLKHHHHAEETQKSEAPWAMPPRALAERGECVVARDAASRDLQVREEALRALSALKARQGELQRQLLRTEDSAAGRVRPLVSTAPAEVPEGRGPSEGFMQPRAGFGPRSR